MIEIEGKLVAQRLFEEKFVCDLSACKGACCVEGDVGAPLEEEELSLIDQNFDAIEPFLREEGKQAIREQGRYIKDALDNEWVTPLVAGKECAYATFDQDGTAKCGIEQAYRAGKTNFLKPISCHLYPIRTKTYPQFEALNYDEWEICSPACSCGSELNVKVYKFLKEPLIRKYGEAFFESMEEVNNALEANQKNQD